MSWLAIGSVSALFLAFGLFGKRLDRFPLTGPMIFVAFGLIAWRTDLVTLSPDHILVHGLAEVTLVVVLFADAARIDIRRLRREHALPIRLLFAGIPLTVLLGTGAALLLLPVLSVWEAALVATILAATDAALGQAVVSSPVVPLRIRNTLNVESGLNDGLALPFVLIFASLASMGGEGASHWIRFGLMQVSLGPLAGIVVGALGALGVQTALKRKWTSAPHEGIATVATAALAVAVAEGIGGNGFIAAFVAGLTFGNLIPRRCDFVHEFAESEGQLLTLATFGLVGACVIPHALANSELAWWLYAVAALTVIRMLATSLALTGAKVRASAHLFLGWFGPRGLASILFAMIALEEVELENADVIRGVVAATVLLSVFLHGASAFPLANWFGKSATKDSPESESATTDSSMS